MSDGLVVVLVDGFYCFDFDIGVMIVIVWFDMVLGICFNDGKVDCVGNFFVGLMWVGDGMVMGKLWWFGVDGVLVEFECDLVIINVICFFFDGGMVYLVDSFDGILCVYCYDGVVFVKCKVLVDCCEVGLGLDGVIVDVVGNIWVVLVMV